MFIFFVLKAITESKFILIPSKREQTVQIYLTWPLKLNIIVTSSYAERAKNYGHITIRGAEHLNTVTNDRCDGVKCENVDGAMFGSARVEAARHRAAEWAAASTTLRAAGTRPPRTNADHPAHPSRLYLYLILVHACNANDFLNVMGFGCGIFYFQQEGKNVSCEEIVNLAYLPPKNFIFHFLIKNSTIWFGYKNIEIF